MTTATPASGARVVGRRRSEAKRETFTLAVYRGETEELWPFTVRAQMDTSSVFSLSADNVTAGERLGGLRNFLMRAFVDDDGVSLHEKPVMVAEAEAEGDDPADEDAGSDAGRDTQPGELVVLDPEDDTRGRDVRWRVTGPNGIELFPSESLARNHADENGSSLRRLIYVMDSPYLIVEQSALEEIVDVIVSAAADRPTEASGASSRSRPRRAR